MRNYGILDVEFFRSPTYRGMTDPQARLIVYLFAGPMATMSGCYYVPPALIADEMNWTVSLAQQTLGELGAMGVIEYDTVNRWVLVRGFLRANVIHNDNQMKALRAHFEKTPETLKVGLASEIRQFCKYPLGNGFERVPERSRNQRQRQIQGQLERGPSQGEKIGEEVVYIHAHTHTRERTREGSR